MILKKYFFLRRRKEEKCEKGYRKRGKKPIK